MAGPPTPCTDLASRSMLLREQSVVLSLDEMFGWSRISMTPHRTTCLLPSDLGMPSPAVCAVPVAPPTTVGAANVQAKAFLSFLVALAFRDL